MLRHCHFFLSEIISKRGINLFFLRRACQQCVSFGSQDAFELKPVESSSPQAIKLRQNDNNSQQSHKIFQQYLTLEMQGKQNQIKRNEDTMALIAQEWQLVLSGKSAEQLVDILQNYQLDLMTNPIEQNQQLLQIYVWALLATGSYLQLKYLIARYKQQLQKNPFTVLAEAGAADNVKSLCKSFIECIKNITDHKLICRLREATLKAVLNILSKYFTTYKSSQIASWLDCRQQDLRNLGYAVQGGFVELKKGQKTSECLVSKLKQLAIVANRMSKFE